MVAGFQNIEESAPPAAMPAKDDTLSVNTLLARSQTAGVRLRGRNRQKSECAACA